MQQTITTSVTRPAMPATMRVLSTVPDGPSPAAPGEGRLGPLGGEAMASMVTQVDR